MDLRTAIELTAAALIFFCVGVVIYLRFFSPFGREREWIEDSEYMCIVKKHEHSEAHQREKAEDEKE